MRITVDLDPALAAELSKTVSIANASAQTILLEALRAGLPALHGFRPNGYFNDDYDSDPDRLALENSMASIPQFPER